MRAVIVLPSLLLSAVALAEVPLFDGGPYPASVQALGGVTVAFLNTVDFRRVCRAHPQVGLKLLAAAGRRLGT